MASNWKECTDNEIIMVKDYFNIHEIIDIKIYKNPLRYFMANHRILEMIAEKRGFDKITIRFGGEYIGGTQRDLTAFLKALREEAMEQSPPSLTQIVCRHICENLNVYQNDPKFKNLPKDLLTTINEEAIFCLKRVS